MATRKKKTGLPKPRPEVMKLLKFIAANAYRARHELDLTQDQVATKARMEVSFYQRIERAKTNLSLAALLGVAEALQLDVVSLFTPAELHKLPRRGRPTRKKK